MEPDVGLVIYWDIEQVCWPRHMGRWGASTEERSEGTWSVGEIKLCSLVSVPDSGTRLFCPSLL